MEVIGGAARGKAIIILNPADPPMIMRDTIFCAIPEDADQDAITASIKEVVAEVQTYVPGYRLLNEPQFDPPSVHSGGQASGDDVRGGRGCRGLPAAVCGEPGHHDRRGDQGRRGDRQGTCLGCDAQEATHERSEIFFNPMWDVRMTDTSLRDGSHHKRHQFTTDEVRSIVAALDAAGVPVIEVTHGDGLGGSSFNYGFSKTPEQELIKLAAETATNAKIAFLMLPGVGHQGGHQGGAEQRRLDLPDRHPLHRGRRLDPALRAGPRTRVWRPSGS